MTYLRCTPGPRIASIVESIWVQESTADAATTTYPPTRVIPTGFTDVAFYFRDPFFHINDPGHEILPPVVITGPQTSYCQFGALGQTGIVIVRFWPGKASAFLHCPIGDLRDVNVDLSLVLSAALVHEVEERIREATDHPGRIAVIEEFVGRLVQPLRHPEIAYQAVHCILRTAGRASVRNVAKQMSVSVRHLERICRDFIGLSPKVISRIVRLQRALEMRETGMQWAAIAHSGGYQDQSHLCNDSMSFSGLSPEALDSRSRATELARYFNHGPGMSHFCKTIYA